MSSRPLISVVIPNRNGAAYLENCLRSLLAQNYPKIEIVVVDNASSDPSLKVVHKLAPSAVVLKQEQNLGFAGGANVGIQASTGEWIAVLNNDTEVSSNWLSECVRAIELHPDAAFLACRIVDFKNRNRIHSAGDCFLRCGIGYRRGQDRHDRDEYQKECQIFSASGCAALYRAPLLKEFGGYDQDFFAYLEDVELGLRLQAAGHRGYYVPAAVVYHHGAATSGGEFSPLSVRLRTRNSLYLLLKRMPSSILLRCLPMIGFAQVFWLARVVAQGKMLPYFHGLGEALLNLPRLIKQRRTMGSHRRKPTRLLWDRIVESEALARQDFLATDSESHSRFLKWYFRLF